MKIEKRIKSIIRKSDSIFVSGHKSLDLDAIGACIGIKTIARCLKKKCYIIIDDTEHELSVSKVLDEIKDDIKIIKSSEVSDLCKKNSTLVVVDTNKTNMIQNDKILHCFNNIIVIDHHQENDQSINGINLIDITKSSACEIIADLIKLYRMVPTKEEATMILSGIILDTCNYTKKVSDNTYYSSYFLAAYGASSQKVRYYLKEDIKNYIIRNKVIMNVKVIKDKYAVSVADKNEKYKKEDLAKIADTLLNFNGIDASFVIANRIDGGVGISARSEGLVDVGKINEEFGGGGDIYHAASFIKDMQLKEVEKQLTELLNRED